MQTMHCTLIMTLKQSRLLRLYVPHIALASTTATTSNQTECCMTSPVLPVKHCLYRTASAQSSIWAAEAQSSCAKTVYLAPLLMTTSTCSRASDRPVLYTRYLSLARLSLDFASLCSIFSRMHFRMGATIWMKPLWSYMHVAVHHVCNASACNWMQAEAAKSKEVWILTCVK